MVRWVKEGWYRLGSSWDSAVCQENIILCNIYEPVKDDECKIACEIKATYMYDNPEIPNLKYLKMTSW